MAEVIDSTRGADEPIYLRIRRTVRERIETGVYQVGTTLPSENELAEEFGATRLTVRNAIDDLVERGMVRRMQGKGTYVASASATPEGTASVPGFREMAHSHGHVPTVRILERSKRLAGPFYASIFDIDETDVLYHMRRLNSLDGMPYCLESTLVPLRYVEGIEDIDLSVFSLYETYAMFGHKVALAQEKLKVLALTARDARFLEMAPGDLALMRESLSYDAENRVIEHLVSLERGNFGYTYHF